jgi:hypothetical protein
MTSKELGTGRKQGQEQGWEKICVMDKNENGNWDKGRDRLKGTRVGTRASIQIGTRAGTRTGQDRNKDRGKAGNND